MKITLPAMKGRIGKRDYYVAMIKLNLISKIFSFHEWAELPPEQRAQRVLQRTRVPEITQYILDNEDGYLFSSLTASFDGEPFFKPSNESHEMGLLELPLESQFVINDGQHRMAAIIEAMKQNPTLGSETISVVFFPFEDLDRMQQMFSDLNRTVKVTSKSLNILYDHRDLLAQIVLDMVEKVPVFKNMVDKDRVSLPLRSPKLFTLSAIYDATYQLVGEVSHENYDEKAKITLDYWETLGGNIHQWKQVWGGDLRPSELRSEYVNSHAVVLWGLGAMGKILLQEYPTEWISRLHGLTKIDWRRINKEWQGICMQGPDILNRIQTKKDTAAFLKHKMGLPLTSSEEKSIKPTPTENSKTVEKTLEEKVSSPTWRNQEDHISQDALIPYIVEALQRYGGRATKQQIEGEIFQIFKSEFSKPWYQERVSHGVPRWKHNIAFAKERAKLLNGYIKNAEESGRGYWELTETGKRVNFQR